jgi:hypothetical protein
MRTLRERVEMYGCNLVAGERPSRRQAGKFEAVDVMLT